MAQVPGTQVKDEPGYRTAIAPVSEEFRAQPDQVGEVRQMTARVLDGRGSYDLDVVLLLVSEVATNAVLHSRSPHFHLSIETTEAGNLRVTVSDHGRGFETAMLAERAADDETSGRGLFLLGCLASAWGTEREPGRWGVWFEVSQTGGGPSD